ETEESPFPPGVRVGIQLNRNSQWPGCVGDVTVMWNGPPTVGEWPGGVARPSAGQPAPRPNCMEPMWKRPSLGIERRPGFMRIDWVESTWFVPVQVSTNQSVTGTSVAGWTVPAWNVPWDVRRSVTAALLSAETAGM